jgi:hypothetical protein
MEHSAMHDMSCHPSIGATFLLCAPGLLVGELKIRRLARDKMPRGGVGFKGAYRTLIEVHLRCAKHEFRSNFGLTM